MSTTNASDDGAGLGVAGLAYRGIRERVTAMVESAASPDAVVPACPEWRIHELVAHLSGVIDDVLGGRLDGAGTDPWTEAQVAARRERPTADVMAEWATQAPQVEAMVDSFGPAGHQLVMDAVTHEHDLRGAVGSPGGRDSDAVRLGLAWLMSSMTVAAGANGLPSIAIRSGDQEWRSGEGTVIASVSAAEFDLLRSATGRRTLEEIRSLHWEGDIDAALPAFTFGPFAPRPVSLGE